MQDTKATEKLGDIHKSPERQLAEIRDRRAKLAADKAKRDLERQLTDELEREKQALADDEALAKLEAEHPPGKLKPVATPKGLVVLQRPRTSEYQRFIDGDVNQTRSGAFVSQCVLYPSSQQFSLILDELPGILPELVTAALELAGVNSAKRQAKS